ncbi:MAG: carbohydrate kinase family protein [Candidatus Thermoplasmatota archaeon]|nr:carbohydrate kinase family protein [Candidatus Thermoplasmatota archaeon]
MEPSLQKRLLQRLQNINQKDLSTFHVVMLPDFFLDHILSFSTMQKTCDEIKAIASQGGGNIPGITQDIHQGGNAANTALGLARFGMSAHLICQTSSFGRHVLDYFLGNNGVDLSGVKSNGNLAITAAMEYQEPLANVMIGDPGSVATFSFEQLHDHDIELITSAHLVGVTNWNLNRYGTELASQVFAIAKKQNVRTFFDSGDPSPRLRDIPELVQKVLMDPSLDIFGLNENELNHYSNTVNKTKEEMIAAVASLKKRMSARIDLHTSLFSSSFQTHSTIIPTIPHLTVRRITGAGDAWNAANIFADLLGFADDERLLFANIAAGQYISSPSLVHSTIDSVIYFIKKTI